ncbi:hypothetical protein [Halomonas urumqiensis]|nr:hypothetical protein [Halomonas urumqiensis]
MHRPRQLRCTLSTGDADTGIEPIFDAESVKQDVQAQTAITQEFGSKASQAWGDYASQQEAQLWLEAQNASDPDIRAELEAEASRWAEGGAYRTSGHTLLGLAGGGVDGASGALTSSVLMSKVERLTDDMDLPDGVRQGLESLTATLVGAAVGNTPGGAMAFNLDANNRQLHSFEQALAEQLAEGSEYTPEQISDALRAMYNDELAESPGSNLIVDLQDVAGVDDTYFDYGSEWVATPGEDGKTRYLIQQIPKNTPPELIGYIIEQTGGESSPYRAWEPSPSSAYPPREQGIRYPYGVALAAGLPYNLNDVDTRTLAQMEEDQDKLTRGMASMAALPFTVPYTAATLTARGAAGLFATGAGFDAAGQMVQGGEYRPGQTLTAGSTALVYGPLAGRSPWRNAAVGGALVGTHTSATNWLYDEDKSVPSSVLLGAGAAGVGTGLGEFIKRDSGWLASPYLQMPAAFGVSVPNKETVSKATETAISNLPSFISLPDINDKEGR